MPPTVSIAECIDYKTYGVTQQREYESWVKKIEEIKQLVALTQCTNIALEGKLHFRVSPFYQLLQKHKLFHVLIVKCLSIAYFIGNISTKKISKSVHMYQSYSKPNVGRFLRHGVVSARMLVQFLKITSSMIQRLREG